MGGNWRHHPGVRSEKGELSLGERAADRMRNGMGSWGFVFAALAFLALWMVYNGHHGFDAYPFILLNLLLSCLAAMQGAILLIAAKRADQISSELAQHDFEADLRSKELLEALSVEFATMAKQHRELHGQFADLAAGLLTVEAAGLRGADALAALSAALRGADLDVPAVEPCTQYGTKTVASQQPHCRRWDYGHPCCFCGNTEPTRLDCTDL